MLRGCCLALIFAFSGAFPGGSSAASADCGDISIASMSWGSAEVMAEIDKLILSAGYGCNVVLSGGETMPTFANMNELGEHDLIPEVWVNSVRKQVDAAVSAGKMILAAEVLSDGGEEGWWIPGYIAEEHPQIKTVGDALARPDLFSLPEEPASGAIFNCPPDWACRIAMDNLYRAHGAEEKGFTLIDTGSAAGLDASIASAFESKSGWLGYYWAPTSMLGRFDMVKLDMGEHDPQQWISCTAVPDCTQPRPNAWPASQVFSIVTDDFAQKASIAMDYVSTRQWSNDTINEVLAWMEGRQATAVEVAYHFLENYEAVWSTWVSADVATKVKGSL